ncbi:MAG: hypothetical protein AAFO76_02260 [Cyanobacteria bacterium J06607_15]
MTLDTKGDLSYSTYENLSLSLRLSPKGDRKQYVWGRNNSHKKKKVLGVLPCFDPKTFLYYTYSSHTINSLRGVLTLC